MNLYDKDYLSNVMTVVDSIYEKINDKTVIYLEGGHFSHNFGADDFAINTLNDAIVLGSMIIKKYQRNIKLTYGILIDDLGLACSEESCSILPTETKQDSTGSQLPSELEYILSNSKLIKRDKVLIFSERTSKNRAIDSIKKIIKKDENPFIFNEEETHTEIKLMDQNHSFVMARRQGHTFTAKCPAIMSQHYKDILTKVKQRFADVTNIIIIDWSDLSDKTKVTQGRFALSAIKDSNLDINHSIINIFFGDDTGEITEVNHEIHLI
ncbi:hypothetical protein MCL32_14265 [Acinetobacter pittii]|uniref:hypothetical protein n=1 Tax=Acinetobacter pittii TaxID=48296 RepID=UPI001EFC8518|nr:hypothetical protein [Acinetobacter pittii]MCG9512768.1 hypothetical protein [Acinetobacter pittii]